MKGWFYHRMKVNFKSILLFVVMILGVVLLVSLFGTPGQASEDPEWLDIMKEFENDNVTSFVVTSSGVLKYTTLTEDGKEVNHTYQLGVQSQIDRLQEIIDTNARGEGYANLKNADIQAAGQTPWIVSLLPYILVIGVVILTYFLFRKMADSTTGRMNSFSKAKPRVNGGEGQSTVHFTDVAGADEEKEELQEVVEFLRDPARFTRLGARIPRGVLLVGPPGTGKTLLAKAVAGEANVPFFSISGSDFVEMYVGVGASRVRDLFDTARKNPAAIIFIDEIDAVGRHRGAGLGGGNDEREQTLNQLLVEMDGFGTHQGIIVMAATNRPDVLDPALLRPGRFDRQITVGYPDIKGREEILLVHAKGKPFEETVSFRRIAQLTIGFTGADLANLLNEAALLAARRKKNLIGTQEIEDAFMKMLLGPRKKSAMRNEYDNRLCAYHEAGHAVAAFYAPNCPPVKQITILPAGNTGGVTVYAPEEDRLGSSRGEMLDNIVSSLGGRVAEQIAMDDISTGASSDIRHVSKIAYNMVTRYGMSEKLGTVHYGSEHSEDAVFLGRDFSSSPAYSETTATLIDEEVRRIVDECYKRCEAYLTEHREKLDFIAAYLLKHETMDGDIFRAAMEQDLTMEQLEEMEAEKHRKSEEENRAAAEHQAEEEPAQTEAEAAMFAGLGIELPAKDAVPSAEESAPTENPTSDTPPSTSEEEGTQSGSDDFWNL